MAAERELELAPQPRKIRAHPICGPRRRCSAAFGRQAIVGSSVLIHPSTDRIELAAGFLRFGESANLQSQAKKGHNMGAGFCRVAKGKVKSFRKSFHSLGN